MAVRQRRHPKGALHETVPNLLLRLIFIPYQQAIAYHGRTQQTSNTLSLPRVQDPIVRLRLARREVHIFLRRVSVLAGSGRIE